MSHDEKTQIIDEYIGRRGRLYINAVPGSGKTTLIVDLAHRIYQEVLPKDTGQKILMVTYTRSGVASIIQRLNEKFGGPQASKEVLERHFFVTTLHGLANEICSKYLTVQPYSEILDDLGSTVVLNHVVNTFYRENRHIHSIFKTDSRRYDLKALIEQARRYISIRCFNEQIAFDKLSDKILNPDYYLDMYNVLEGIYQRYREILRQKNAADFNNLIDFALVNLSQNDQLCKHLAFEWPYILEDEAQDSTEMQYKILQMISKYHEECPNWVRVGDINQAIMSTFTLSSPDTMRQDIAMFPEYRKVLNYTMRCPAHLAQKINRFIDFLREQGYEDFDYGYLNSFYNDQTSYDDIQIYTCNNKESQIECALNQAVQAMKRNESVAILTYSNDEGKSIVQRILFDPNYSHIVGQLHTLLRIPHQVFNIFDIITTLFKLVSDPSSFDNIVSFISIYARANKINIDARNINNIVKILVKSVNNQLDEHEARLDEPIANLVEIYRKLHSAIILSPHMFLNYALNLIGVYRNLNEGERYICHQISKAIEMDSSMSVKPYKELNDYIVSIQQKIICPVEDDSTKISDRSGELLLSTMHRSKGLQFDTVIVTSCGPSVFPLYYETQNPIENNEIDRIAADLENNLLSYLTLNAKMLNQRFSSPEEFKAYINSEYTKQWVTERIKLFYVVLTRAKKRIIFVGPSSMTQFSPLIRVLAEQNNIEPVSYNPSVKEFVSKNSVYVPF